MQNGPRAASPLQRVCMSGTELRHNIACAWAAFHKHKSELCGKYYRWTDRIKLFQATVSTTLLYGCSAWSPTNKIEQTLVTERRRMLRYVFRVYRHSSADWVDYMKRSAHKVDEMSTQNSMQTWVASYHQRKWRFAGDTARRRSKQILSWTPTYGSGRFPGRLSTRWSIDLEAVAGGDWETVAQNEDLWRSLEEGFSQSLL